MVTPQPFYLEEKNMDQKIFERMLDVIEENVMPLTAQMVQVGCKVFGAAILRRDDLSLVLAATNHEAMSPLWHGEVYAIKQFWEMQGHPDPADCLFLATHQPCCMCASAIAWSGFPSLYYLFGYEQTGNDFNIPHDQKMIRELFGCVEPAAENSYYHSHSLMAAIASQPDPAAAARRFERIQRGYADLSAAYQAGEKRMVLK